jgi:aspartate aminotransferase-like enzyme
MGNRCGGYRFPKSVNDSSGLAFVALNDRAWKVAEENKAPKYYWDFVAARKFLVKNPPQTPNTPAVSLLYALQASLRLIMEEGLDNVFKRHELLAKATRAGVKALGLQMLASDEVASNTVTAVCSPEGIDVGKIRKLAREKIRNYTGRRSEEIGR